MKESSQHIRSFVRRQHRMTPGQARALQDLWPAYGLSISSGEIDTSSGEWILEIGFGMGQSLLDMALQFPEKNFLGIEVYRPGIGALLSAAARQSISNIRIYNDDAIHVLKQCIKDNSLSKILIYFPDPWPKNRQQKRRLIQPNFALLLNQKLKARGQLHLATDCIDYAEQMLLVLEDTPEFCNCAGSYQYLSHNNQRKPTKYEQKSKDRGGEVWEIMFEKR